MLHIQRLFRVPTSQVCQPRKKTQVAAEQQRPDVVAQRWEFQTMQKLGVDPNRFVFLDETWVKTNMTRLYGRCPVGQHLIEYVPHGHWKTMSASTQSLGCKLTKTTTFLSALRTDGLFAPLVVDGAINGAIFLAWVKQQLAPTLRSGDIVVMDNLAAHKVAGVRQRALLQTQFERPLTPA